MLPVHTLRLYGVRVTAAAHQVRLSCLLQRLQCCGLKPIVSLKCLAHLTHKTLEGGLPDQQLR